MQNSFALKFTQNNFNALIDKQESYKKIQNHLSIYCDNWRKKKKVNHGGITANHLLLVYALLKILPASMEYFREHRKRRFQDCLKKEKYVLETNRITLAKKMIEDQPIFNKALLPSTRTVTNLLNRLEDAKIILTRRTIFEDKTKLDGKKSILVTINPEFIVLYPTKQEVLEHLGANSQSDTNSNLFDQEPVDQEPVDQEPVDQEPVDQEPVDFLQGGHASSDNNKSTSFQHYTNSNKRSIKYIKKKNTEFAKANGNFVFNRVGNEHSKELLTDSQILAYVLMRNIYKKTDISNQKLKIYSSILDNYLDSVKNFVQVYRKKAIENFTNSPVYKNAKKKVEFLKSFGEKLPNVEKSAFEILCAAIQIQSEYLVKNDYQLFMNPAKYLSDKFMIPLNYAKNQFLKNWQHDLDNLELAAHAAIRSKIWAAVSSVAYVYRKNGEEPARNVFRNQKKIIQNIIHNSEHSQFLKKHAGTYLQRFIDQVVFITSK